MNTQSKSGQVALIGISRYNAGETIAQGAFAPFPTSPRTRPLRVKSRAGDLVLISDTKSPRILKKLGRQDSVTDILRALLVHSGETAFTDAQLDHAQGLERGLEQGLTEGSDIDAKRVDLTGLTTFTIDGDYSKDFDDAISARREGAGEDADGAAELIRVWVHVADVTAYVKPGDILDHDAKRRATSIYLPGMVAPMLPEALSNGLCSLMPGVDRRAVTCEMLLENGRPIDYKFYRSMIRSDARLTYNNVNKMFLGLIEPGLSYAAALSAARAAADADNFEDHYGAEPSFIFTEDGKRVRKISYNQRGKSEHLIERLMILANHLAAELIRENARPGQEIYRAHDGKSLLKVASCLAKLASLGIHASTLHEATAKIDELFAASEISFTKHEALTELIRHTNIAADYTNELRPHSGLELTSYTHFTSPIRRYADIIAHRLILDIIDAESYTVDPKTLAEDLKHINERTRIAKKLERTAGDICRASYLHNSKNPYGRKHYGIVSGMSENGIFVRLAEAEGFISGRAGSMHESGAIFTLDGQSLKLGDELNVEIESINRVNGRIRLKL